MKRQRFLSIFFKVFIFSFAIVSFAVSQPLEIAKIQTKLKEVFFLNRIVSSKNISDVKTAKDEVQNSIVLNNNSESSEYKKSTEIELIKNVDRNIATSPNVLATVTENSFIQSTPLSCACPTSNNVNFEKSLSPTATISNGGVLALLNQNIEPSHGSSVPTGEISANGGERGAGEYLLAMLKTLDEAFLEDLERLHKRGLFTDMQIDQEKKVMASFRMAISEDKLFDRFGEKVDAITDRSKQEIIFDEFVLTNPKTTNEQIILILLHEICRRYSPEYFQAEDTYQKSIPLYQALLKLGQFSEMLNITSDQRELAQFFRFMGKLKDGVRSNAQIKCSAQDGTHEIVIEKTNIGGMQIVLNQFGGRDQKRFISGRKFFAFNFNKFSTNIVFEAPSLENRKYSMYQLSLFTPAGNSSKITGAINKIQKLADSASVDSLDLICTVNLKEPTN